MLRISRRDDEPWLRLEGRLTRYEVALLREAVRSARAPCALELADLAFVDEAGAAALRNLRARGVTLRGGSPFVRLLLGEGTR